LRQRSAERMDWLRRLHRSHAPEIGPYATCMHRDDAATVSYTEITASGSVATMRYQSGPPCCRMPMSTGTLKLRRRNLTEARVRSRPCLPLNGTQQVSRKQTKRVRNERGGEIVGLRNRELPRV
jgi:hypothetical protein